MTPEEAANIIAALISIARHLDRIATTLEARPESRDAEWKP